MVKKSLLLGGAVLLMLGLAACGGSKDNTETSASPAASASADAQKLDLVATNFKFDKAEYKVKAGQPVTVTLKNDQGVHGIEIKGQSVKLENGKTTATFTPKAGKYDIICTIPCGTGHINMKSVLVVE